MNTYRIWLFLFTVLVSFSFLPQALADADGDGFDVPTDCNDDNDQIFPGQTEVCNGIDDDCDNAIDDGISNSTFYADADKDGFGDAATTQEACTAPSGYVADNTDCDDTNANLNPGESEACNGIDDDCDNAIDDGVSNLTFYADADEDGFGDASTTEDDCSAPAGYVANDTDCDDTAAAINPDATDTADNGADENCDGADASASSLTDDNTSSSSSCSLNKQSGASSTYLLFLLFFGLGVTWILFRNYFCKKFFLYR